MPLPARRDASYPTVGVMRPASTSYLRQPQCTLLQSNDAAMGSSHELVVLTAGDVDKVLANLDLELALKAQQDVFSAFSTSCKRTASDEASPAIQIPHRSSLTTDSQRTLVMPSRAGELLGCKFVGIPNEGSGGLPGSTVLLDPETGRVRGLVNARKLTALRNACGMLD